MKVALSCFRFLLKVCFEFIQSLLPQRNCIELFFSQIKLDMLTSHISAKKCNIIGLRMEGHCGSQTHAVSISHAGALAGNIAKYIRLTYDVS